MERRDEFEERACCCALNGIFGYEPRIANELVRTLGSASAVFGMDEATRRQIFGQYSRHADRITMDAVDSAARELERLEEDGCRFVGLTEDAYPPLLKECEDAPAGLYFRSGDQSRPPQGNGVPIAVIGTRNMSLYGREWTRRLIKAFASAAGEKAVIVSGLAYGIDVTAHRAALDCGLETVAVMATGPDSVYPPRHAGIAAEIASSGALVTDFPPGTEPKNVNFLRRNRIIAGMSRAVVLIESRVRGGGMMTSGLAFSYGRDVYALPGRADDQCSLGCNWLIRSKKAEAVFSEADLVESLGLGKLPRGDPEKSAGNVMERYADRDGKTVERLAGILSAVRKKRGISLDELASGLGIPWQEARRYVSMLECDGLIQVDLLQRCSISI